MDLARKRLRQQLELGLKIVLLPGQDGVQVTHKAV